MKYAQTAHNMTVCDSKSNGPSVSAMARSFALRSIPTPLLRHSLSVLEMLRISSSGPLNRRKLPERYVQLRKTYKKTYT
jgi:hypothetical protein